MVKGAPKLSLANESQKNGAEIRMRLRKGPSWDFPPTHGGVEVVREAAATNFRESPLDKFVREILQNSTDAHDHNAGPVEVVFREELHPSSLFGAEGLLVHARASERAAKDEKQPKLVETFQTVAEVLGKPHLRCLTVSDFNTTGLSGDKWDALILKAGSNRKDGPGAGGSQGVGKNAVFNVSAAKTAFYYTCFQNGKGRKRHRVEKWMGKSVLACHDALGERRQHIGFFRSRGANPIEGAAIPTEFRAKPPQGQLNIPPNGTAITILGFEPRDENWAEEVVKSAAANFFHAIHRGELIVTVEPMDGEPTRIDRAELRNIFSRYALDAGYEGDFARARAYYDVVRAPSEPDSVELPAPIGGSVSVRVVLGDGPSRSAYVNKNGMLVTDLPQVHKNPFHIQTSLHSFPRYAIVVTPDDDHTNDFILELENPAHDEVQTNSVEDKSERNKIKEAFKKGRQRIIKIVDAKVNKRFADATANLRDLASMLGEDGGDKTDADAPLLATRVREINVQTASAAQAADTPQPGGDTPQPPPQPGPDVPKPPRPPRPPRPNPPTPPRKPSSIGGALLVSAGARKAVVTFTTAKTGQTVKLKIAPSGEMESREDALGISAASEDGGAAVTVADGDTIEIQAGEARPYRVRIDTDADISKMALSVRNVG